MSQVRFPDRRTIGRSQRLAVESPKIWEAFEEQGIRNGMSRLGMVCDSCWFAVDFVLNPFLTRRPGRERQMSLLLRRFPRVVFRCIAGGSAAILDFGSIRTLQSGVLPVGTEGILQGIPPINIVLQINPKVNIHTVPKKGGVRRLLSQKDSGLTQAG